MKKRHARASVARGNKADHQNNPAPICLNSSVLRKPQIKPTFLLGRFQPLLGREPASVP